MIKEVRTILNLGLKESKDLVEKAPCLLKSKVNKEEVNKIKEILEKVGCKIELI